MTTVEISRGNKEWKVNFSELTVQLSEEMGEIPVIRAIYPEEIDIDEVTDTNIDKLLITFKNESIDRGTVEDVVGRHVRVMGKKGTFEQLVEVVREDKDFNASLKTRLEQAEADIVLLKQQVQQLLGA